MNFWISKISLHNSYNTSKEGKLLFAQATDGLLKSSLLTSDGVRMKWRYGYNSLDDYQDIFVHPSQKLDFWPSLSPLHCQYPSMLKLNSEYTLGPDHKFYKDTVSSRGLNTWWDEYLVTAYRLPQLSSSFVSWSISEPWKVMEKLSILISRDRGWMPRTPVQERASLAILISSSSFLHNSSAKNMQLKTFLHSCFH